jgi:hypothetical protein
VHAIGDGREWPAQLVGERRAKLRETGFFTKNFSAPSAPSLGPGSTRPSNDPLSLVSTFQPSLNFGALEAESYRCVIAGSLKWDIALLDMSYDRD